MDNHIKFTKAIKRLNPQTKKLGELSFAERAGFVYQGEAPMTEEAFNKIEWVVGVQENGASRTTTDNPHSHLTWEKVSVALDDVQAEYDAQDYARKRQEEYPSIESLVVALYDSDDKVAVDEKRAAVKLKYPKP